jgi:hypothetical protein
VAKEDDMKHFKPMALALAALLALSAVPAQAETVTANIPFSFIVNGKTLPAGRYAIDDAKGPLFVKGATRSVIVLTMGVTTTERGTPRLVFHKAGDQYALSEAWTSETSGRQVPRRKVEQELARAARGGRLAGIERVEIPLL